MRRIFGRLVWATGDRARSGRCRAAQSWPWNFASKKPRSKRLQAWSKAVSFSWSKATSISALMLTYSWRGVSSGVAVTKPPSR